ncbi:MAG: gamma-glutamyl-gamma-aminobutyrate hydrolase family protein [Streptococcaceae bacterium]|nr:gamma-glutamyl-gamma-aminobutyrate hydrolase family protein [Streptococcaceae bacterium]
MKKPIIAITSDSLLEPSPIINLNLADFAPRNCKEAIITAGGIPLILPFPPDISMAEEFAEVHVNLFDGLILPGGPDVDPTLYGEEPIPELGGTAYQRDAYEIALVKAAVKAGKAVFGICRGLQLANVAFGGSLYQDLKAQNPNVRLKHSQIAYGAHPTHHVEFTVGSQLEKILGSTTSYVNSRHHQAVKEAAPNLKITAYAEDGIVEALESVEDNIVLVQWHPENMWQIQKEQLKLFEDLVKRASKED